MIRKNHSFFICSIMLLTTLPVFAQSCPTEQKVKQVKFIRASQDPYESNYWYFNSDCFDHHGSNWNISFGTHLPSPQTPQEALQQGQAYFNQIQLVIKNPDPVRLPKNTVACDYIPAEEDYFITAFTPPEGN